MSFSTLPDLCIVNIFDRIPLSDLLGSVNLVCHRWNANRLFACHRRRVLILAPTKQYCASLFGIRNKDKYNHVVNDDGTPYLKPSSAQLRNQISRSCVPVYFIKTNFTDEMCAKLIQLLPNIRQLSINLLDFNFVSRNHRDFGQAQIATTFPNVQFMKLEYLVEHCTDCGYDTKLDTTLFGDARLAERRPSQPTFQRCSRLAIKSLKSCAKLRRILLYSRFREGGSRVDTIIDNPQENL